MSEENKSHAGPFSDVLEQWQSGERSLAPIVELLGIEPVSWSRGRATVAMRADRQLHNALGTVHGGVFGDLADVAMGVALATVLNDGESFASLDLNIHFLESVRMGRLEARATVLRRGRSTAHLSCDVIATPDGNEVCVARVASSCVIHSRSPS